MNNYDGPEGIFEGYGEYNKEDIKMSNLLQMSEPRKHPQGWAVDVMSGETKLATCYGATKDNASYRADAVMSIVLMGRI